MIRGWCCGDDLAMTSSRKLWPLPTGLILLSTIPVIAAVLRRDFARHRAWMIRGYAIGIGAGTQAVTQIPVVLAIGPLNELTTALMMLGAWLLNLAVAEWFLRGRSLKALSQFSLSAGR